MGRAEGRGVGKRGERVEENRRASREGKREEIYGADEVRARGKD